ncbi:MAG TPA: 50S ribosomal protein L23 [Candidatus Omnitrophica bacterium]|jgi:large subunit ribosomal protein L23|nr:50S ribosomal protein L23 [Candidatus Omnitrophota bacterium]
MDKVSIYSVIKSPLLTEKTNRFIPQRKYAFLVDKQANKIQIKRAIEKLYNVKVEKINTLIVKGRTKRLRWNQPGKTSSFKKAIVTLKEGFEIKIT